MTDEPTSEHHDEEDGTGQDDRTRSSKLGGGVGVGAAVGTAMFAATGDAFWIAIGVGMGAAISLAFSSGDDD